MFSPLSYFQTDASLSAQFVQRRADHYEVRRLETVREVRERRLKQLKAEAEAAAAAEEETDGEVARGNASHAAAAAPAGKGNSPSPAPAPAAHLRSASPGDGSGSNRSVRSRSGSRSPSAPPRNPEDVVAIAKERAAARIEMVSATERRWFDVHN